MSQLIEPIERIATGADGELIIQGGRSQSHRRKR